MMPPIVLTIQILASLRLLLFVGKSGCDLRNRSADLGGRVAMRGDRGLVPGVWAASKNWAA
jgi:hypothetical protein